MKTCQRCGKECGDGPLCWKCFKRALKKAAIAAEPESAEIQRRLKSVRAK